jgi:hypothetical protein
MLWSWIFGNLLYIDVNAVMKAPRCVKIDALNFTFLTASNMLMIDTVFFIFRPLNLLEKGMKSLNIVDCPNNREVVVKERPVDRVTRTFAFDRVFGPNSKQVSNYFRYSSNCNSKRFIHLFKYPVILLVYNEL